MLRPLLIFELFVSFLHAFRFLVLIVIEALLNVFEFVLRALLVLFLLLCVLLPDILGPIHDLLFILYQVLCTLSLDKCLLDLLV